MALTDHDIVISPNRGLAGNPNIRYVGADASNSATITVSVTNAGTVGTLTYAGAQANIITLSDGSSAGSGMVKLFGLTDTVSTASGALQVMGGVGIGKSLYVAGNSTFTGNLTVLGTLNAAINTATNAANAYGVVVQDVSNSTNQYFPTMVVNNVGSQPLYDAAFNLSFYPNNAQLLVGSVNASSFGQITGLFAAQRGGNSGIQLANTGTNAGGTITIGAAAAAGPSMQFYTYTGQVGAESASEKMRIHTNGFVGVGTSNPVVRFQTNGQTWLDNASGDTTVRALGTTISAAPAANFVPGTDPGDTGRVASVIAKGSTRAAVLTLRNIDNNSAFWDFVADGLTNKLFIQKYSATAGTTPAFTIDQSTNNVGITNTATQFRLSVGQDITMDGDITNNAAQFAVMGATTPAKRMIIGYDTSAAQTNGFGFIKSGNLGTAWSNLALQPNGGNVGIGTTTPGSDVTMSGGLTVNGSGTTQFNVTKGGTGAFALNAATVTTGDWQLFDKAGGTYNPSLYSAYGKVLIGLGGSTQAKFSVLSATGTGSTISTWGTAHSTFGPNVTSQTGAALGLAYNTTSDQSEIVSIAPGVAWKPLNLFSNALIVSANSGVEVARFNSTGLGIGVTPAAKLHSQSANGTAQLYITGGLSGASNQGAGLYFSDASDNSLNIKTMYSGGTGNVITVNPGNTEVIRFQQSGNVGVGNGNVPFSRLTVFKAGTTTYSTADASNTAHLTLAGTDQLVRLQMGVLNAAPYAGWIQASYDNGGGANGVEPLLLNPGGGNVQIGLTADQGYKLYVNGTAKFATSIYTPIFYDSDNTAFYVDPAGTTVLNGLTVNNQYGDTVNYATPQGWTVAAGSQTGYFGGNFNVNGDGNSVVYNTDPFGRRALVWQTRNNDAGSDADGGWDKTITGISASKSYMSVVYIRRTGSSTNGSFYHGCDGGNTLNLNGTANGNPYFSSFGIGTLPQDVWCVSVGFIQANGDANTSDTGRGGLYRMDTGQKLVAYTDYKMSSGATQQTHRTYLYYSTDPAASLDWWGPGFYEINGMEPTLDDLVGSTNRGWTRNWFAPQYFDSANTTYYTQPSSTSVLKSLQILSSTPTGMQAVNSGATMWLDKVTDNFIQFRNTADNGSNQGILFTDNNQGGYLIYNGYGAAGNSDSTRIGGYNGIYFDVGTQDSTTGVALKTNRGYFDSSSNFFALGSARAPIFYDSDNTSYFFDGASRTRMSTFDFGNASYYVGAGDWGMRNTTPYGWIQLGPANTGHAHIYTDRSNFYFNVNDLYTNGNWVITENYTQNGKYLGSDASIRAQIFYDQANTAYYMNLNSTTDSVKVAGYMGLGGNNYNDYMSGTFGHSIYHANYPSIGWNNQYRTTGMTRYWMMYLNANSYLTVWNSSDGDFLRFYPGGYTESTTSIRAPLFYDSNDTGRYLDPNGTSYLGTIYCGDVYNHLGGWFRNYGATGIYNQSYGNHWYADNSQYWNVGSGTGVASGIGIRIRDGFAGSIKMYMYADNSGSGLLDSSGSWKFRMEYGNANAELYNITYMNDCRPYIIYDRNDTTYYLDPNGTSFTKQFIVQNGYGHQANGYNNNGGFSMNNAGTYWGVMANVGTNDWRLGYGSSVGITNAGWNLRWDNGSTTWSNGSHRAPIFYDSDDTGYYIDPNSTSDAALRMRGGALFGPNVSWGAYLYVGSNGRPNSYASMVTTNGNLHLDCQNGTVMYLNYYSGNAIYNRLMYDIDNSGYYMKQNSVSRMNEVQSDRTYGFTDMRTPILYDYNNTGYYWDGNNSTREYSVTMNILNFAGVGGDSGVGNQGYAIYQQGGGWGYPYPDLAIGYHTGIKIGAYYGYNGTRFYNNNDFATIIGSFGDGDNNLRSYYDIIAYASDRRLKENIRPIQNAVTKVRSLLGMVFDWKDMVKDLGFEPNNKTEVGVFAQDVEAVLPEAVAIAPFDYDWAQPNQSKSGERYLTVKYEKLVPLLIEAIKEQQDQIEELRKLIEGKKV